METVAMYWESQIKTYGFHTVKALALYRYAIPADLSEQWGRAIALVEESRKRLHLLCAQLNEASGLDLLLLCKPEQGVSLARHLEAEIPDVADCRRRAIAPVELLFFQGPHFGDRFGVADFTYKALMKQADLILAAAFSCASIYLILPEGAADETKTLLAAAFRIPG